MSLRLWWPGLYLYGCVMVGCVLYSWHQGVSRVSVDVEEETFCLREATVPVCKCILVSGRPLCYVCVLREDCYVVRVRACVRLEMLEWVGCT